MIKRIGLAQLVVFVTLLTAGSVFAATCTVNTTADEFNTGSACSFREAVQSLNTGADFGGCSCDTTNGFGTMDTVIIPAGTYDLDIGANGEDENHEGDVDIRVSMTIDGAGQGDDDTTNTIIRMAIPTEADRDRVLEVLCLDRENEHQDDGPDGENIPDCPDGLDVTIQNVQIRDGQQGETTDGIGGGLFLLDAAGDIGSPVLADPVVSHVTLSNVNITANRVVSHVSPQLPAGGGGGVASLILNLTIDQGSTIHDNDVDGPFAGGLLALTKISLNDPPDAGSQLSILNSDISSNRSGVVLQGTSIHELGFGGGVLLGSIQTVLIEGSTIEGNETLSFGGGIMGVMTDVDSGAIVAQQVPPHSSLVVHDTTIAANRVNNDVFEAFPLFGDFGLGGGVYLAASGPDIGMLFDTVTLAENLASIGGGLVYTDGLGAGGLVNNDTLPPPLLIKNSSLYANQANGDGTLVVGACDEFDESEIVFDIMAGVGGGILNMGTPMAVEDSTFAFNDATNDGGAVANLPNLFVFAGGSTDRTNFRTGELHFTNVTATQNQAHRNGGAFRNGISKAYEDATGAICDPTAFTSDMTVQNVILAGNAAVGSGSGQDCLNTNYDSFDDGQPLGFIDSLGNNLFGNNIEADCLLTKDTTAGEADFEVGVDGAVLGLGTFSDDGTAGNGHFPVLSVSTAIDNANSDVCENGISGSDSDLQTDQIFVDRVDTPGVGQDGAAYQCEIGAIEFVSDCGNGVQEDGEECDDGNSSDLDACKNDCTLNICGDGKVNLGVEACEDGSQCVDGTDCTENAAACANLADTSCAPRDGDGCSATCEQEPGFVNVCGDGIIVPADGEECDDGNTDNGDGCSAQCKVEQPTTPQSNGGCLGGSGCGACTEKDERLDLSNIDNLSLYNARSLGMSRSNAIAVLFFLAAVGIIAAVRSGIKSKS